MKRIKRWFGGLSMAMTLTIRHFFVLCGMAALCYCVMVFLNRLGMALHDRPLKVQILVFIVACTGLGLIFSAVFIHKPLKVFEKVLNSLRRISEGDYGTQINLQGFPLAKRFSNAFNHMAGELRSVEVLRNDFINNFSHEFKTPIVSINGFAKMLRRGDLTPAERAEYLDIIISESERLAELSTSVLNLSKLENQHILTDKRRVNISEQIRLAVTMLEKKWSQRKIDIQFDAIETYMLGNEEMLKQVWLNLIDNAIKFSPDYGMVKIAVQQIEGDFAVIITNEGNIPQEELTHIFDKFYQGRTAHANHGNGLGLAIAKKIIELHGGVLLVKNASAGYVIFQATFCQGSL